MFFLHKDWLYVSRLCPILCLALLFSICLSKCLPLACVSLLDHHVTLFSPLHGFMIWVVDLELILFLFFLLKAFIVSARTEKCVQFSSRQDILSFMRNSDAKLLGSSPTFKPSGKAGKTEFLLFCINHAHIQFLTNHTTVVGHHCLSSLYSASLGGLL